MENEETRRAAETTVVSLGGHTIYRTLFYGEPAFRLRDSAGHLVAAGNLRECWAVLRRQLAKGVHRDYGFPRKVSPQG